VADLGPVPAAPGPALDLAAAMPPVVWPDCPRRPAPIFTNGTAMPCSKHGGAFLPCSEGPGKANRCGHSKWGVLATFDGPCACWPCHDWPNP